MKKTGVLFVCTGNICRSPTAEGVFRSFVEQKGEADGFFIDSAGTHGYHIGDPPDSRAIMVAKGRDVDLSGLRARRVTISDFEDFDLILAMDCGHLADLSAMKPAGSRASLALYMDFVSNYQGEDVPDPYYGTEADFEHVLDLVSDGVESIFQSLTDSETHR